MRCALRCVNNSNSANLMRSTDSFGNRVQASQNVGIVCDEYIGYLAAGVTNVVNIFQPDTLAIGGGVSNESDEQLLLPLRRLVEQESIPCNRDKRTRIVKAQLGNNAGIIGAALLGKRKLRK